MSRETSGTIQAVRCERIFAGKEYSLYQLEGIYEQQRVVPTADNNLSICVENGEVVGLANGDPINQAAYSLESIRLFQGKALAIVRSGEKDSQIRAILQD